MSLPNQLYLASRSPRRRQLLEQIGIRYGVLDVDVPERVEPGEAPDAYVLRVAKAKARAGWAAEDRRQQLPVLAADTEVVVDGHVQGKPADRQAAQTMLQALAGRSHEVISTVVVCQAGRELWRTSCSRVWFRAMSEAEIDAYWDTGEPRGKAGGYAVQGLGATFVQRLDGSYSGVMGLPLFETCQLLAEFGLDVLKLR